jgi:LPXTG-motif cell wall-anchored protein
MRANRPVALIVSLLMVFGFVALGAGASSALTYPANATLTVNNPTPKCGETVNVVGTGFLPNTEVTITISGVVVGTAMTDDKGNFTFPYTVPTPCIDGKQLIRATDGTNTLLVNITVLSTTQTRATGSLPRTGSSGTTMHLVQAGILMVAAGGILLIATRKRRPTVDA